MAKTKITETTERYDENGRMVERIVREEVSEDDTLYYPSATNKLQLYSSKPVSSIKIV